MRASARTKHLTRPEKHLLKSRSRARRQRRSQHGGFLNRHDFAYAAGDNDNQAMKGLDSLAPKLIRQTLKEIDTIAEARITPNHKRWGTTNSENCTKNHQGAIENVYKTPFRLLGNLMKNRFAQLKRKISKTLKL